MGPRKVSQYLGILQDDPDDQEALGGLRGVLADGPSEFVGDDARELLRAAASSHLKRGEFEATANLLELAAQQSESAEEDGFSLWVRLGEIRRDHLLDDAGAGVALARALELAPDHRPTQRALEELTEAHLKFKDVATRLIDEAAAAEDGDAISLKLRAASVLWQHGEDDNRAEAEALFEEVISQWPEEAKARLIWGRALGSAGRWEEAVQVLGAGVERVKQTDRLGLALRAAWLANDKLEEAGESEKLYEQALALDPGNARALRCLVERYTDAERWEDLVRIYKASLEVAQSPEAESGILTQLAMVQWRILDRPDDAAPYFERLRESIPDHPSLRLFEEEVSRASLEAPAPLSEVEAKEPTSDAVATEPTGDVNETSDAPEGEQAETASTVETEVAPSEPEGEPAPSKRARGKGRGRRSGKRGGRSIKKTRRIEKSLRKTKSPQKRVELLVDLARAMQEEHHSTERCIEAWKEVQKDSPTHPEAISALKDLYQVSERWNGLVELIRTELAGCADSDKEKQVSLLRELIPVYRDGLGLGAMVVSTYKAILKLNPSDTEAAQHLEETYEKLGRWNDLIQLMGKKVELTDDPAEQVLLHRGIAKLWIEKFKNYNQARRPLERVLELDPEHLDTVSDLKVLYTKKRAWRSLARILGKELELTDSPEARVDMAREAARLSADKVGDADMAIQYWRLVLEAVPGDAEASEHLGQLASRANDWSTKAFVLEERRKVAEDANERVEILEELGAIYAERLEDGERAAGVWREVLEVQPEHARARRMMRDLMVEAADWEGLEAIFSASGDWEGLADALGQAAQAAEEKDVRIALSLRAAKVYEERLEEPQRAFRNYERVLSADPLHREAATALIPIYEKDEKRSRLPGLYEALLKTVDEQFDQEEDATVEKVRLLQELFRVNHEHLGDAGAALRWSLLAFSLAPQDEANRENVEEATARVGAWSELVEAYAARLRDAEREEADSLRRRVADIQLEHLGDRKGAKQNLAQLAQDEHCPREVLDDLRRLYRDDDDKPEHMALLRQMVERGIEDPAVHLRRLHDLAEIEGELDAEAAVSRYRSILELEPDDADALDALDILLTQREAWDDLIEVLVMRTERATDDDERVDLIARMAAVHLGPRDDVVAAAEQVFSGYALRSNDPMILDLVGQLEGSDDAEIAERASDLLEELHREAESWDELATLLERRKRRATDPEREEMIQLQLAELQADRLGDYDAAYKVLESAFLSRPDDEELRQRLGRIAEKGGRQADEAEVYERVLKKGGLSDDGRLELLIRSAKLLVETDGDSKLANQHLREALELEPQNEDAFLQLKERLATAEDWDGLEQAYRLRIDATLDAEEKVELLSQISGVLADQLEDPARAIRCYEELVELEPNYAGARRALARLYRDTERFAELGRLLRDGLEAQEGVERAEALFELASIELEHLEEPAAAVEHWADVLEENPRHLKSQEALHALLEDDALFERVAGILTPLYEGQGAWKELVDVLERRLEKPSSDGDVSRHAMRLAELAELRLHDAPRAFRLVSRAVKAEPYDAQFREELARLAIVANAQRERAEVLQAAVHAMPEDDFGRGDLLLELGSIWLDFEQNDEKAQETFEALVELDPDNVERARPANLALKRIYRASGKHQKLAECLEWLARTAEEATKAASFAAESADVYEKELDDTAAATRLVRLQTELEPSNTEALTRLVELYAKGGEWYDHVEALRLLGESVSGDEERVGLALKLADAYTKHLEDPQQALVALEEAADQVGTDRRLLVRLADAYEGLENWDERIETLRTLAGMAEEDDERLGHLLSLAAAILRDGSDPSAAVDIYRDVLAESPSQTEAVTRLVEGIQSSDDDYLKQQMARVLLGGIKENEEWQTRLLALEVLSSSEDHEEKVKSLRAGADLVESRDSELAGAYDWWSRLAIEVADDEAIHEVVERLDTLSAKLEDRRLYAASLEACVERAYDETVLADLRYRLATTLLNELDDAPAARSQFEGLLELQPEHVEAQQQIERLMLAEEDYEGVRDLLIQRAEQALDPEEKVALLLEQASLCEKHLEDIPGAIAAAEEALETWANPRAVQHLERLYREDEAWHEMASLYERAIDEGLGQVADLRFNQAELFETRLDDAGRAIEFYALALKEEPGSERVLSALQRLAAEGEYRGDALEILESAYRRKEEWGTLLEVLEQRIEVEDDPDVRKQVLRRVADLSEDTLEDAAGALRALARLCLEEPEDKAFWSRFNRVAELVASEVTRLEIQQSVLEGLNYDTAESAALARATGILMGQDEERRLEACRHLERALEFDPEDREAFDALEQLRRQAEQWDDLADQYRSIIDAAAEDAARVRFGHRLAALLANQGEDVEGAIDAYRDVLSLEPADAAAQDALSELLRNGERWSDLGDLLLDIMEQTQQPARRAELNVSRARIMVDKLEQPEDGLEVLAEVLMDHPDHVEATELVGTFLKAEELRERASEILEDAFRSSGAWLQLAELLEERVGHLDDETDRGEMLLQIAQIHEDAREEPEAAFDAVSRALVLQPSLEDALEMTLRLSEGVQNWEALVAVLEATIPRAEDSEVRVRLLRILAQTQDVKRRDPRGAARSYGRLLEIEPEDESAGEQYENLLVMLGDWEGLTTLLNKQSEQAFDVEKRASLLRRVGVITEEMLMNVEGAIRAFERAADEDPSDLLSLRELDRLYCDTDAFDLLPKVIERQLELNEEPTTRARLALRLGLIYEHELQDESKAIDAYRRVLEDDAGHLGALDALGQLYTKHEEWGEALDVLALQMETASEGEVRANQLLRAGDICRLHLERPGEALDYYRSALEDIEGHREVLDALSLLSADEDYLEEVWGVVESHLLRAEAWDDVVDYLGRLAELVDGESRLRYLRRMAEVHESRRQDPHDAFEAHLAVFQADSGDAITLRELLRLAPEVDRWGTAVDCVEQVATETEDPEEARSMWIEAGGLIERELKDAVRALAAYEAAAELGEENPILWAGQARQLEQLEEWEPLAELLERWGNGAEDASGRHEALIRLAMLRAERFDDKDASLAVILDIVQDDPSHEQGLAALVDLAEDPQLSEHALRGLEDAYRATGATHELIELYELRGKLAETDAERIELLLEAASLWSDEVQDGPRALEVTKQAFRLGPQDPAVIERLESLAEENQSWESLRGLIEEQLDGSELNASGIRDLNLRAASWYADRLGDDAAAEGRLRAALDADGRSAATYRLLVDTLIRLERVADAVEVLVRWAGVSDSNELAVEMLLEAAQLAAAAGASTEAEADCYEKLLERRPDDPSFLEPLIRIRLGQERWADAASRMEELVAVTESAEDRCRWRHELGALYRESMPNRDGAIANYKAILEDHPADAEAVVALDELYQEGNRWEELAALLEAQGQSEGLGADELEVIRLRLAAIYIERLERAKAAVPHLQAVLRNHAKHEQAAKQLEEVYRSLEDWTGLQELLEEQATLAEAREDVTKAVSLLLESAELAQERASDPDAAIGLLQRLLEWEGQNESALTRLESLYEETGAWSDLLEFLNERLEVRTGEAAFQTAMRIASIAKERLEDIPRTESAYRYALELDANSEEASNALRGLLESEERWEDVASLLESRLAFTSEESEEDGSRYIEISRIFEEKLGDAQNAARLLARATEIDTDNRELLTKLCDLYVAAEQAELAIPVLRQIVDSFGGKRSKDAARFHHRLGRALEGTGDLDGAMTQYDAAFRIDLTNVEILRDLGKLCMQRGDYARAQKTFRALLLQRLGPDSGLNKSDVYTLIGECQVELGDMTKAKGMLRRALDENPDNQRAQDLLARAEA